ncbi:MAG: dUTP diphosphatase [Flavobacteriaceae bacterium]|nr:dUTP diphosphatase [Flavobacteriaceae bacterium]PCJ29230.1 MAG: dUTP diphosphatase [Rickettsiales bacterium]
MGIELFPYETVAKMESVNFVLDKGAVLPVRGSKYSAGLDIFSNKDIQVIPPKSRIVVKTGVKVAYIPKNHYIRIAPRSGLSVKEWLDVGAGVVDEDYRGYIGVVIHNHKPTAFTVKPNMRISQLVITPVSYASSISVDEATETERGESGFGSTGIF